MGLRKSFLLLSACAGAFQFCIGGVSAGTFSSFDPPGSKGTYADAMNEAGVIVGHYQLKRFKHNSRNVRLHGFLRTPDGTIVGISVPDSIETIPADINGKGQVTGCWDTDKAFCHGFVRSPSGEFSKFDVPGASSTVPVRISSKGAVVGLYFVSQSYASHGFVRNPDGSIATFDVPGSTYTEPTGINGKGLVVGYALTDDGHATSFVRAADGTIGMLDLGGDTYALAINASGLIAGYYSGKNVIGFVRAQDGSTVSFDPQGNYPGPYSINSLGALVGTYRTFRSGPWSSFLRNPDGSIVPIEIPDTTGITATSINSAGIVAGYYRDKQKIRHGFVGVP